MNQAYDVFLAIYNNTLDETYIDEIRALDSAFNNKLFDYKQVNNLRQLGIYQYYEAAIEYFGAF
jgi:hypothetical protein